MVNKELVDYIKSVKEKGFSDVVIKANLLKYNYTQEAIDEAFKELEQPKISLPPLPPQNPIVEEKPKTFLPEKKKKSIVPLLIIAFLVILLAFLFLSQKNPLDLTFGSSSKCENVTLEVHKLKGEPVVCAFPDNSKIQLIIANNGQIMISKAEIIVNGEKGKTVDKLENLNLEPNDVFTRTFNYDFGIAGEPKSITLTPFILSNGLQTACNDKKMTYDKIGKC